MVADTYDDYRILKRAFVKTLGYSARQDIPADLIEGLASFCDTHAADMMMSYYAASLINQFWRKRNKARRDRFVCLMNAQMMSKPALLALVRYLRYRDPKWFGEDCYAMIPVWEAIRNLPEGYGKANDFNDFARFIQAEEVGAAYQRARAMPEAYRARALAGLYARLDAGAQADILVYLFTELELQCREASAQLRRLFPSLDHAARRQVGARFLAMPHLSEHDLAYFVIRNGQYINRQDAVAIADRLRRFRSEYLRIRSLLKLANHLPAQEIGALCSRFLASFEERPASVELIHNLYHVSTFTSLSRSAIVTLALRKIAQLDNGGMCDQEKYNMLSFLSPHLETEHQDAAYAIANQVKGGYRRTLLARLRRELATPGNAFVPRSASLIH